MKDYEFDIGAITDKGLIKQKNEDNILIKMGECINQKLTLLVVCDGLGGLSAGEIASLICINKFEQWWKSNALDCIKEDKLSIINSLKEVVYEANSEIIKYGEFIKKKVGTTVSAILILRNQYYIVHIGDSRIYKINKNIEQLTEDQSFVMREVKRGNMTKEEAKISNKKNILLQCVGIKEKLDIFSDNNLIYGDEIFLICSDGFYNKLNEENLKGFINKWRYKKKISLQDIVEELVQEVKSQGERDNISVIICAIKTKKYNLINGFKILKWI